MSKKLFTFDFTDVKAEVTYNEMYNQTQGKALSQWMQCIVSYML
jgi:hypothetical protein